MTGVARLIDDNTGDEMKFNFSKYNGGCYSCSSEIAQDLHEFAKSASKEEFVSVIDELVDLSREEEYERACDAVDVEL